MGDGWGGSQGERVSETSLYGNLIYDRAGTAIIGERMDYLIIGYPHGK